MVNGFVAISNRVNAKNKGVDNFSANLKQFKLENLTLKQFSLILRMREQLDDRSHKSTIEEIIKK